eukprot:2338859-Prymnesium_polylepis.1
MAGASTATASSAPHPRTLPSGSAVRALRVAPSICSVAATARAACMLAPRGGHVAPRRDDAA